LQTHPASLKVAANQSTVASNSKNALSSSSE